MPFCMAGREKTAVNEPRQETFTKDVPSLDELEQEMI